MSEEPKTVVGQLHEVAAEICDDYCKWPDIYRTEDGEKDSRLDDKCEKCPLGKLGL